MKNFFNSTNEKITEKAFSQGLIISVVSILLCLVALCSMTYAWFSGGVTSDSNSIEAGCFDLTVSMVKSENGVETSSVIDVVEDINGVWSCTLEQAGTYTVTLTMTKESTVKGFCVVALGNDEGMQTESITKQGEKPTDQLTFTITTTDAGMTVTFTPKWGVPPNPEIFGIVEPVADIDLAGIE